MSVGGNGRIVSIAFDDPLVPFALTSLPTMTTKLTHFDDEGNSRMVDVGSKPISSRAATASAQVVMQPATIESIRQSAIAKGDVLEVARLAGIMAAKQTSQLIPLCHPLSLDAVDVRMTISGATTVGILATVRCTSKTGVEMEALTAASVAALTIYDMCKSIDRGIEIGSLRLESKTGGKSGDFTRDNE